jgi:hypothetical protein
MLQFSFPSIFAVFGVRHKAQRIDDLAVKMHRCNQPVIIPADVEHQHRSPAADFHGVRVGICLPHVHQVAPRSRLDRLAPNVQVTSRRGMSPPLRHEKRFFNDAHGDNLYSFARFVKHD